MHPLQSLLLFGGADSVGKPDNWVSSLFLLSTCNVNQASLDCVRARGPLPAPLGFGRQPEGKMHQGPTPPQPSPSPSQPPGSVQPEFTARLLCGLPPVCRRGAGCGAVQHTVVGPQVVLTVHSGQPPARSQRGPSSPETCVVAAWLWGAPVGPSEDRTERWVE